MTVPLFFTAGMTAFFAVIVVLGITRFSRLRRYLKNNPEKKNEDWDPFG